MQTKLPFHPRKTVIPLPDATVSLYPSLFTQAESDQLLAQLLENTAWRQDKIKIFGKLLDQPRLTAWYGDEGTDYSYSGITMQPQAWNDDLLNIKNRVEKEAGIAFNSVLLNYYRHGKDSMGWHQDNEKELGQNPVIASVSFGATRPFQLKHIHRKDLKKVDILLTHGSLLLMEGSTQHFWKHQIPKTTKPIGPRLNLTFRVILQ